MELTEIMRLFNQALLNLPNDAPEKEKTQRALGALCSHLDYSGPEILTVLPEKDSYYRVRYK